MSNTDKNKREYFSPGALTAPLPAVLVTVGEGADANVLTIAWTGIISTIPPRTYVSVRPSRHSYKMLSERGEFVINLPSADMVREVDFAGIYTGAKMDKFERCGFTKIESREVSAPTIAECPIALECRVAEVLPMGSHDCFIADIVSVSCRDDILLDGRICYDRANLLAYAHGEYFALGEKLGRFGFSTDKGKKKSTAQKSADLGQKQAAPEGGRKATENSERVQRDEKRSDGETTHARKSDTAATRTRKNDTAATRTRKSVTPVKAKKRGKRPFGKPKKSSIKL